MRSFVAIAVGALILGVPASGALSQIGKPDWPPGAERLDATTSATTGDTNGVSLSWLTASAADEYLVFQATDECERDEREQNCEPLQVLGYRNVSTFVEGLVPGETYIFWVKACNSAGCTEGRSDPWARVEIPLPIGSALVVDRRVEVVKGDFSTTEVRVEVDADRFEAPSSVMLSVAGLPSVGARAEFDPSEGEPPFTSVLRLSASENSPVGTHQLTITAAGGGMPENPSARLTLEIVEPEEATVNQSELPVGFDLVADSRVEVLQGDFSTTEVRVEVDADRFEAPSSVMLSVAGLPSVGARAEFDPSEGEPPFASVLRLSASENSPVGTHQLTITAAGGGVTDMAATDLNVLESEASDEFAVLGLRVNQIVTGALAAILATALLSLAGLGWRRMRTQEPSR